MSAILISNSFPFSLVRRPMRVEPRRMGDLLTAMHERPWFSAWGHENTVGVASAIACADLRPATARPALVLDAGKLPSLDGQSFDEVWLLSPDYSPRLPLAGRPRSANGGYLWLAGFAANI